MLNIKVLKEHAYDVLKISLKADALQWYIAGVYLFSIKAPDENGKEEECIFAKMEAIYKYYKENPDSELDKKVEQILTDFTIRVRAGYALINILKCIEYQIVAEKENRAPFKMNTEKLLNNLKCNLEQNKQLYSTEDYNKTGFMTTIHEHDEMLSRNYGHKIL